MDVRDRLFKQFELGLDKQAEQLMLMESKLISYCSSFAFSSNYYTFFTEKLKKELFQIIFNEHLLDFLTKRIEMILSRQQPRSTRLTSLSNIS
jgi:hypothetical protein